MTGSERGPATWIIGRGKPPVWVRLIGGCLFPIALAGELVVKRGVVIGIVAAVVYGVLGLSALLAWERMKDWSRRHPVLDRLITVPVLFLAVAYLTRLSTAVCLLIAVLAGLLVNALGFMRRRKRQRDSR